MSERGVGLEDPAFQHWVKTFVEQSPTPQMVHTPAGRVVAVNPEFTRQTGYELSDLTSFEAWLCASRGIHPEFAAGVWRELRAQYEQGRASVEQCEVVTKSGTLRLWQWHPPVVFRVGDEEFWLSTAVDVTEQQRALAQAMEDGDFVDRIFRTHPTMLYVFDLEQQRPIFQNRHIGESLGYSFEEIEALGGELLPRLMHPLDFARLPEHFERIRSAPDNEIIAFEYRMRHRDGAWSVTVSSDTVFRRDERGRVIQFLGIATDVTAARRAEQEKLEMSLHVQELQKMESLAMLAGGIAHDFNNLLIGIMGSADLAVMQLPTTSPAHEDLKRIQSTAIECAELCKQLLAYAGKGKFVVEPFFLAEMIQQIGHLLQVSISKKVALRYDFADNVPPVEGDIRQIRQVIMNLIKNASDAIGDKSGIITVSVGLVEANRAYLEGALLGDDLAEGYFVTLEVSDTGCGMPREILPKIFDPFFSSKREGRGLGLAAVRGIIKSHAGALRVYSEVGKGSCFKILLPASQKPVSVAEAEKQLPAAKLGGGTVLVVDDEETVRAVVARSLKMAGFSVLIATDGREAVAIYREYQSEIRAVLLDMMMPGLGGAATFQRLRQHDPNVAVVLMSGYNEQEATNAFAGKGLAGFLQKPFRQEDLLRTLEHALNRKTAAG